MREDGTWTLVGDRVNASEIGVVCFNTLSVLDRTN